MKTTTKKALIKLPQRRRIMNATHQLLTKLAFWYCQSSEPVHMDGKPTFDEACTYAKEIVDAMDNPASLNTVAVFDFWDWSDTMFDEVLYIITSTRKAEVEKARKPESYCIDTGCLLGSKKKQ